MRLIVATQTKSTWMQDRIESYLDGSLPDNERQEFELRLATNEAARRELEVAMRIRTGLASLPRPVCPAEVHDAALAYARGSSDPSRSASRVRMLPRLWLLASRPVRLSIVAAVLVGAILTVVFTYGGVDVDPGQSVAASEEASEEVELALNQAKWAIAFVTEEGRKAGSVVREDVLYERIALPVGMALEEIQVRN